MRKPMSQPFFKSIHTPALNGFSAIELLAVICIVGILSIGTVGFISKGSKKICLEKLRTQLFLAQEKIAMAHLRDFLYPQGIGALKAQMILSELAMQNPHNKCTFSYTKDALIAHIDDERLLFHIHPSDLSVNPRIYCDFSSKSQTYALCKDFFHRILDK